MVVLAKYVKKTKPALFLDRDGVINIDYGYVFKPEKLELLAGISDVIAYYKKHHFWIIVITNQAGVAKGYFRLKDVYSFHQNLQKQIMSLNGGYGIDAFYICPHHPKGIVEKYQQTCLCRKPQNGLLLRAISEYPIDLSKSLFIGDKDSDILCAKSLHIKSIRLLADKVQYIRTISADRTISRLEELIP